MPCPHLKIGTVAREIRACLNCAKPAVEMERDDLNKRITALETEVDRLRRALREAQRVEHKERCALPGSCSDICKLLKGAAQEEGGAP